MSERARKLITFTLRWGIAVFGIYYVISNMSLYDRVMMMRPGQWPVSARLTREASDQSTFDVIDPDGLPLALQRQGPLTKGAPAVQLLVKGDRAKVTILYAGRPVVKELLGLKVTDDPNYDHYPLVVTQPRNLWQRYWNTHWAPVEVVDASAVRGPYHVEVPYPLVERGVKHMLHHARGIFLLLAFLLIPITYIVCAYRWHELLKALDINLRVGQAFVICMVGAFYNTFMPGSTGGDVLKAYYASRVTPHRTRAVMSVFIDRIIGLLALIILGGGMAATQWSVIESRRIAMGCGLIVAGTALGLLIFYQPVLHRLFGLEFILARLPMQKQVRNAIQVMEIYRHRPWLVLWSLVVTFPVHMTVIVSATMAGMAFGLPLNAIYYWSLVPVVVLVGAIPISPQGAGVMEFFAIALTKGHGCSVSDAFALTMSIRIVQIFWNLTGGYFVMRGNFHAPPATAEGELATSSAP